MSDLNATPVEPVPEGIITENEVSAAETPAEVATPGESSGELSSSFASDSSPGEQPTGSTVTSNQLPDTLVTPTEPDATASAAESVPVAPETNQTLVAFLNDDTCARMHDLFLYIHEAFETVSLAEGLSRFYEIAKAVKARAEA